MHLKCPGCAKVLMVADSAAGTLQKCPGCALQFRVPAVPAPRPEPPAPILPSRAAPAQEPPATYALEDLEGLQDASPFGRLKTGRANARRQRKILKVRKRHSRHAIDFDIRKYIFFGVVILGVLLFGLSIVAVPVVFLMLGIGMLFFLIGETWCLVIAFQEDFGTGMRYLFWPLYRLHFVTTNFETCGVAGTLMLGGLAYEIVAFITIIVRFRFM